MFVTAYELYFLAMLDKHGIQVMEGFSHDSFDMGWANESSRTIIENGKNQHNAS
jgi:hypothetical protein